MNEYAVYFELYGKKMRATVHANSAQEAEAKVRTKLTIVKVDPVKMGNPMDPTGLGNLMKGFEDLLK